jgi:hypothetical protein
MPHAEFDAKDMLDRYIALIKRTGGQGPQDIARLPAPKDVIKDVLLDVLRKASPDMDTTPVKRAFVLLATFQDPPDFGIGSVDDWLDRFTESSDSEMQSASPHRAAHETPSRKSYLASVEERMELEGAALAEELARAGF